MPRRCETGVHVHRIGRLTDIVDTEHRIHSQKSGGTRGCLGLRPTYRDRLVATAPLDANLW